MAFVRKQNRIPLKSLYQGNNWYFVTICTAGKKNLFVEAITNRQVTSDTFITNEQSVKLNQYGKIIEKCLFDLLKMFTNIIIDKYVIMPNHIHFIIGFDGVPISAFTGKNTNLGNIIKRFKLESLRQVEAITNLQVIDTQTVTAKNRNVLNSQDTKWPKWRSVIAATIQKHGTIWQKSFYDHIIRNEKDLNRVREYISNNPLQWHLDEYNVEIRDSNALEE
jgi:putative transposase